jgi:parallel beta-helix repeat protein
MEMLRSTTRVVFPILFCIILSSSLVDSVGAKQWPYDTPDFPISNISINGNPDLLSTAEEYGWPGTGTKEDPIIIEGLEFYGSDHMFVIAHTDLHFVFANNTLDGVCQEWCAIVFWELENAVIADNVFMNANVGIHFVSVNDSVVFRNTIHDSMWDGIFFENKCYRNNISANTFYGNSEAGIYLADDCQYNRIMDNHIYDSAYGVVISLDSDNNIVERNYCHDLVLTGLSINTRYNQISNNHINDTEGNGIVISRPFNVVSENCVNNNSVRGVRVNSAAHNTTIQRNIIRDSGDEGLYVLSDNNTIVMNDLIGNGGEKQALDNGQNNLFDGNHWNDWIAPDVDLDGVVDQPYVLDGSSANEDINPHCTPINTVSSWTPPAHPTSSTQGEGDILTPIVVVLTGSAVVGVLVIVWLRKRQTT